MINSGSDLVCCGYKDISEYGILDLLDLIIILIDILYIPLCLWFVMEQEELFWSKIYKKDIIVKHNLKMDESLFMSEDLVFVLQYVSHCRSFAAIKEYLYNYNRLNQSSISSNISIGYIQNYITVCKRIEKLLHSVDLNKNKANEMVTKKIQGYGNDISGATKYSVKSYWFEKSNLQYRENFIYRVY